MIYPLEAVGLSFAVGSVFIFIEEHLSGFATMVAKPSRTVVQKLPRDHLIKIAFVPIQKIGFKSKFRLREV